MKTTPYPSDLTDAQWAILEPLLPRPKPLGRPRKNGLRQVLNAILYRNRNGFTWRALPHDFPPWAIVYQQAMRWLAAGVFEAMVHDLRVLLRDFAGRKKRPAAA